ncbi:hypothetical protein PM082_024932 [Marasmius tenuissimus]|nr:hypothetical protein PM082_024932 [Marasmius tenuissimus]
MSQGATVKSTIEQLRRLGQPPAHIDFDNLSETIRCTAPNTLQILGEFVYYGPLSSKENAARQASPANIPVHIPDPPYPVNSRLGSLLIRHLNDLIPHLRTVGDMPLKEFWAYVILLRSYMCFPRPGVEYVNHAV